MSIAKSKTAKRRMPLGIGIPYLGNTRAWRWLSSTLSLFIDVVEPLTPQSRGRQRWVVTETEADDFDVYQVLTGKAVCVGKASALDDRTRRRFAAGRDNDVELRIDSEKITHATIKIPAGGLDYIEQIVASRLDRLTPWKPEKVLYGFKVDPEPGLDGQTKVLIAATSREIAAASVARLEQYGLVPTSVGGSSQALEQRLSIDLFRGQNNIVRWRSRKRVGIVAVSALVISTVAFAASIYFIHDSSRRIAELDEQIKATSNKLVAGSGDATQRAAALALLDAKTVADARVMLIDRLSAIIPDNTYLDELDIQQDTIRMAGTSSEASALIRIIESEPVLSEAKFSAPVTRQADGRDRFDISAVLKASQAGITP